MPASHPSSGISALLLVALIGGMELGRAQEFETSYNARFERENPMVGKAMPDVEIFDSTGRPFRLTSAEDKYTVVVFGCLT
ncbi:MAG: hypothetical protein ACE361_11795 [Aureliella sp.]